jgi:hypothetical protein
MTYHRFVGQDRYVVHPYARRLVTAPDGLTWHSHAPIDQAVQIAAQMYRDRVFFRQNSGDWRMWNFEMPGPEYGGES